MQACEASGACPGNLSAHWKCQSDRNQRDQAILQIILIICKSEKQHKHQRKQMNSNDKARNRLLELKFRG